MAPKKATSVDIKALKQVLSDLQDLQDHMNKPPADSFEAVGDSLESDLKGADGSGMQGNAAEVAGTKYHESTVYFNQGWGDVKTGVTSLISLLTTTIAKHSGADSTAANNARSTNTAQGAAGAAGKD